MEDIVEIWKDIKGYEGYYQVSNLGRVRSLDRIDGSGLKRTGKILSPGDTYGYKLVILSKDRYKKNFRVHRLVAEAFIANPGNLPEVHHKDGNRSNNNYFNLQWVTKKYNMKYRVMNNGKPVNQYDLNGNLLHTWASQAEAASNGFTLISIHNCCNGMQRTHKGYIWEYADLEMMYKLNNKKLAGNKKPVIQCDLNGKKIKEWSSAAEAVRQGFSQTMISACCRKIKKTHRNYIWKYADKATECR